MGLFEFKKEYKRIPDGKYLAEINSIFPSAGKYGEGYRVVFYIKELDVYRTMFLKKSFTTKSRTFELLIALGFSEKDIENIEEKDLLGKQVYVYLRTNKSTNFQEIIAFEEVK